MILKRFPWDVIVLCATTHTCRSTHTFTVNHTTEFINQALRNLHGGSFHDFSYQTTPAAFASWL